MTTRLSSFLALIVSGVAAAQPVPKLNSLSPEWIQRGTTIDLTFSGENLGAVSGFVFNGDPGLSATNIPSPPPPPANPAVTIESSLGGISRVEPVPPKDEKKLVVRLTATAEASLSVREVRVVSPAGVSNPLLLNVGQLPEVSETGGNHSPEQAQMISLPATVSGTISAAAQVDYFRFKASKGQELVFEVDASRRGSALDSSLAIRSTNGQELALSEDAKGLDSLIVFTVPEDGEYIIQLRDFRYQGGGNYTYRLSTGALPYLDAIFPLGGQRGKQIEVALVGRNLAGTSKMVFSIASTAALGSQDIRARTPNGFSNPLPFDVSDFPNFLETEPNNTTDKVNTVTAPVVINGRIGEAKDIDRFKFKSAKDQKLICEVLAGRFGSRLDALLVLTDAAGAVLAQNDDTAVADARIEFDAKKDAEYILSLRDLTDRGGDNFSYRLSLGPPNAAESGFVAKFLPDTLRVHRGSRTPLRCEVTRLAGFDGPVRFAFQDLPAGVSEEPLVLTTAPSSGLMMISALPDAPLGSFPVKLTAHAVVAGKTMTRRAGPLSGDRGVKQAFLTILDRAPFLLEPVTLSASLDQNESTTIEVMAQRREGFTGEIKLTAEGFSAGRDPLKKSFDVGETTLKAGESLGKITLKAKLDSEVGTRTFVVRGESTADGQAVTQYSPAIPVTVAQFPFVISSTLSRLTVTALPTNAASAASETETKIKVDRRAGFTNEVALTLEGLPAGVITTLANIPANTGETTLKLVATDKTPSNTNFTFTVVGASVHNDRNYKSRSGGITLVVNAPEPTPTNAPPATAATTGSAAK